MASITIRHVPDETRDELAARAAAIGRSMQEYLLQELIELASRPDPRRLVTQVRDRKRAAPTSVSADTIIHHLDEDRR